jgi:hypothetical protein
MKVVSTNVKTQRTQLEDWVYIAPDAIRDECVMSSTAPAPPLSCFSTLPYPPPPLSPTHTHTHTHTHARPRPHRYVSGDESGGEDATDDGDASDAGDGTEVKTKHVASLLLNLFYHRSHVLPSLPCSIAVVLTCSTIAPLFYRCCVDLFYHRTLVRSLLR